LEGPDGSGKSTLAKLIFDHLNETLPGDHVELLHKGPPHVHPLKEYEAPIFWMRDYRPGTSEHLICDRWHLGEVIYPAVLDRPSAMTPEVLWHIEMFLRSRGALIVHVDEHTDTLMERVRTRGDDLINPDQLQDIRRRYYDVLADSMLRTTMSRRPEEIVKIAQELDAISSHLNNFGTYVGPRYPDVLLFGEVRNVPQLVLDRPTPAFMPYPATSGAYLLRSLLNCPEKRDKIGVANACDRDDPFDLWWELGQPFVVSLGAKATLTLRRKEIFVSRVVNHPQYVRRFKSRFGAQYARQILYGEEPTWS
jgi:thymidylate kinase